MDIWDKVPVIKVAIRGANGRMGMQAIYASMENNEDILKRAKKGELRDDDVWIDIVFGACTADVPTVQQLLAGVMRSEKSKILEGYDKVGRPVYRQGMDGKYELRTHYVEQGLEDEPQRNHLISFDRQEIVDTPEGLPAIKILSSDRQEVLSIIRHSNIRLGELSSEAIMDRVLDVAYDLGANVLLSCVGDTAKKQASMAKWLDKIHEKDYAIGFLESAPAKGWEKRLLSRQSTINVQTTRNYSPTGTLFKTALSLKRPLFESGPYDTSKAIEKFKTVFGRIVGELVACESLRNYAKLMDRSPKTIQVIEGEPVLVNFPPDFLTLLAPDYLKFSFYEDNEYGFVCASMIPTLKALGLTYKSKSQVKKIRQKGVKFEAVTNIPGLFGTDWIQKAPEEIILRGGAMSTSSCTTNGNVVGDFIIFTALICYYDFFQADLKEYFLDETGLQSEIMLERKFQDFKKYVAELVGGRRSDLIRRVFSFYYDEVRFMDTDMQHGLTRAESPDVIAYLRETTSGSMTEVPRIVSLADREIEYFQNLRAELADRQTNAADDDLRQQLQSEIDEIDRSIETIESHINVVGLLEKIEN